MFIDWRAISTAIVKHQSLFLLALRRRLLEV
jgi:hypothetical protein